jgi:hypothetical protein
MFWGFELEVSEFDVILSPEATTFYFFESNSFDFQGAFADFEEPISEVVADAMEEARSHIQSANEEDFLEQFCLLQAACNAYLAYDAGMFKVRFACFSNLNPFSDSLRGLVT